MSIFSMFKKRNWREEELHSKEIELARKETDLQIKIIKSDLSNLEAIKIKKEAENKLYIAEDQATMIKSFAEKKLELAEDFNTEWREVEHDWHQGKEEKMTELAKLDAKIDAKNEYIELHDSLRDKANAAMENANAKVIEAKDTIILAERIHSDSLKEVIKLLVSRIPVMDMKALNIDVDCKIPPVDNN